MTMAHSTEDPVVCLWPLDPACLTDTWNAYEPEVKTRAQELASQTLYTLTGQRVGGCPVVVRPDPAHRQCVIDRWMGGRYMPTIWDTRAHTAGCEVLLPPPVVAINSVTVDGVALALSDLRVDDGRILVWQGGGDCPFPATQDVSLPAGEIGTFVIEYENTYPVDSGGQYAAGVLANEFAKACLGTGKCRLPSNVKSIVRNGVSMDIRDGTFPDGKTGVPEVDRFIALWNPNGLRREAQVWSPDQRRVRRTSWEG